MTKIIDPWGSGLLEDYEKIIKDFGLQQFDPKLFKYPNRLMRRNIIFSGRDLARVGEAIKKKKPFYVLSGIMPSADKIHLGNKAVVENIRFPGIQEIETIDRIKVLPLVIVNICKLRIPRPPGFSYIHFLGDVFKLSCVIYHE